MTIERLIGYLSVAFGISMLFENESVFTAIIDYRRGLGLWAALFFVSGVTTVISSYFNEKRLRITLMAIAICGWAMIIFIFFFLRVAEPLAFIAPVLIYAAIATIRKLRNDSRA